MERIISLGNADSIEARIAGIRDKVAEEAKTAADKQSEISMKLAGEFIVATVKAHQEAHENKIDHKDFMERIFPCALASCVNTGVRNTIEDKSNIMWGVEKVIGKLLAFCFSQMKVD